MLSPVSRGLLVCGLLGLVLTPFAPAANPTEERNKAAEARLKKDVFFLAAPECEGRGPLTAGLDRAADYVARQFQQIGLKPGYKNSYFQPFAIPGAVGTLALTGPQGQTVELKQRVHFIPLGNDQSGSATAPLVFAGHGITCKNPAYDDYAGLQVKDKIVVILRDTPRSSTARTAEMNAGASVSAKLALARKHGAAGVLLVNNLDGAAQGDLYHDTSYTTTSRAFGGRPLLGVALKRAVAERMLPTGLTLAAIEKVIDHDLKPQSFELSGWNARLEVQRKPDGVALKNVIGVLEGSGPLANETVVVGAHYDHIGYGASGSMLRGGKPAIHHGADDNGSGTSGMMELARRFAAMPNRQGRRIVFMAFSGEELGLFGSAHYCKEPVYPMAETAAMLNLDMIGRLPRDEKTGLFKMLTQGHGTAKEFKEMLDNQAKKHGFTMTQQASGFGPSDHASFCGKKVPVLFLWTGTHEDYHRPTDTADKINLEGMRRIVDMSEEILATMATMARPAFVEVKGSATVRPSTGPRLGIRPGYKEGEEGVEVEGVTAGGAAEKGGVKDGDKIVEIGGKPIKDLNAYMQVMATQKAGTTIEIVVERAKKKMTLKIPLE